MCVVVVGLGNFVAQSGLVMMCDLTRYNDLSGQECIHSRSGIKMIIMI